MIQIGDMVWVACVLKTGPAPFKAKVTQKQDAYYKVEGWDMCWNATDLFDSQIKAFARATSRYARLQAFERRYGV